MSSSILIIEDDPRIARLVRMHLEELAHTVDWEADGQAGLESFKKGDYALVILDLMLPGLDGLEVCKQIRASNTFVPILMLTAKSEELDVVLGLELGADEYITKPFSVRELIARVKAIFRRVEADRHNLLHWDEPNEIGVGQLVIYPAKRKVVVRGQKVDLTAKEYELLEWFARHPGRVFNRSELLEAVWGHMFEGYDHTVNSLINRLRRRIEVDPTNPVYIKTVWGVGYRFAEQEGLIE
jgi:DNA-binding response OmpR family regulator